MKKLKIIYCETHQDYLNMCSDYKMSKRWIGEWGDCKNTIWYIRSKEPYYITTTNDQTVGIDVIRYRNIPKTKANLGHLKQTEPTYKKDNQ